MKRVPSAAPMPHHGLLLYQPAPEMFAVAAMVAVEAQGRAERRRITLGWSNDIEAEVRSGPEPGERIVLHPSDRVADGIRVTGRVGL